MKSKCFRCLAFLFTASLAQAWPMVVAPVTLTATATSSDGPYYVGYKATVKAITQRIGNREILQEAVSRRIISDIVGWKIVCRYDATMNELLMEGMPRFYVSDKTGSDLRPIDSILSLEQLGTTASGSATGSKSGKVSGTLNRRVLYKLTAKYQGNTAVCYGELTVALRIVGYEWEYFGVAGACTLNTTGYVANELETLVSLSVKFSASKEE
ncbi:MAG: hypothetical protein H7067_08155 [Burkholderiales bacterium]|nr:hypothetical protein [Opitutaceae bacterium]